MPSEQKLEKLIQLLIRETTENEIEWGASNPPVARTAGTGDVIEEYFETTFKGQSIAVFERRYRGYDPDSDSGYWASAYALAFLADGAMTWETEDSPLLAQLFKVAKESAADVDGILDTLLS